MCILITRPIADAQHTAHDLAALGIDTKIAPLFDITYLQPDIPPHPYQAVIFTSRHSAWNFITHYGDHHHMTRGIPAFCVGNETAAALGQQSDRLFSRRPFSCVYSADGDMIALHALIRDTIKNKQAPILRLHADLESDPLYDALIRDGYQVTRIAFYKQTPLAALTLDIRNALQQGHIRGISFYSPNAARHFVKLITQAGLSGTCDTLTAWCISKNTQAALQGVTFKEIITADHPTHQAMLGIMSQDNEQNL